MTKNDKRITVREFIDLVTEYFPESYREWSICDDTFDDGDNSYTYVSNRSTYAEVNRFLDKCGDHKVDSMTFGDAFNAQVWTRG